MTTPVLPYIDAAGDRRILSCQPTPRRMQAAFPDYRSVQPPIPRSEWEEFDDYSGWNYPIKDQNGIGACMGHATATAFEFAYAQAYGVFRPFSAWFCYSRINGGRDQGATVGDAFQSIQSDGIAPEEMVPYGTWQPREIPPAAVQAAAGFRGADVYQLQGEDDVATAVLLRHPIAFGTMVAGNFGELDSEGVPVRAGGNAGGHAMCLWGGMKEVKSGRFAGKWAYRDLNSWTRSWGDDGTCWMTYEHLIDGWGLDAFAIVMPTLSPLGDDRPMPVPVA